VPADASDPYWTMPFIPRCTSELVSKQLSSTWFAFSQQQQLPET